MDPGVEDGRSSNKFRVTRKGSGAYARSDAVARLILFNKPYGVLSQFTDRSTPEARATLSDYIDVPGVYRSEEHTSELQSLMRISYAVFCLKKKKQTKTES